MPPALRRILGQIKTQGDFPAVGRFLGEVSTALRRSDTSAQQIASVILKDYSLTNSLLRTVNSAFFSTGGPRQVSTVSHALLLMGVDSVANLAVGLRLFDHFQGRSSLSPVKALMLDGLITGIHARGVAENVAHTVPEEAFIAGMMHDLGRLSLAYYLPDAYGRVVERAAREQTALTAAVEAELGVTLPMVAQAVAEAWRFPPRIREAIGLPPPDPSAPPTGSALQLVVGFSRELTAVVRTIDDADERERRIRALRTRYDHVLPLRAAQLERTVAASSERLSELLAALRVSARDVAQQLGAEGPPALPIGVVDGGAPEDSALIVMQSLQDVSEALGRQTALNDVLMMILEGMYRGLGFAHVLLLLVTPRRDALRGRFMLGGDADAVLPHVHFPLPRSGDTFSEVIHRQRDLLVPIAAPGTLPTALHARLAPRAFAALPIVIQGKAIGAFYVDRTAVHTTISPADLRHLRLLRDQAVLAVQTCRGS